MTDLTNLLATMRGRAEAATEGPWETTASLYPDETLHDHVTQSADIENDICETPRTPQGIEDAEFIAHARTDVPRLLAALEGVLALAYEFVSEITDEIGVEEETMDMMRDEAAKRIRAAVVAALEVES